MCGSNPSQGLCEGFVANIPPEIYQLWTPGDRKIAQLELLMVFCAWLARPASFRNRTGIWMVDNIASLMTSIRGRSDSPDLDLTRSLYVPSKKNWADAISHMGALAFCQWFLHLLQISVYFSGSYTFRGAVAAFGFL